MAIGNLTYLSSSHPVTSPTVETTKHSCCCKINTRVQFGGRRWKGLGNKENGGLYLSTRARSAKTPYSWVQRRKEVFKDSYPFRKHGDPDHRGGDGGGGDDNGNGDNDDADDNAREEEFAIPVIKFEEVIKEIETRGASLSVFASDLLEVVRKEGIRINILSRYLDLQEKGCLLAFLMRHCSFIRDRMLADPDFLVKLTKELAIYSCGTTLGELHWRGKDFWAEFELYAADLFVGLLVKSVAFSLYAPIISIGQQKILGDMLQPILTLTSQFWRSKYIFLDPIYMIPNALIYGAVGIVCGLIGQGIANEIIKAKRKMKKPKEYVPVPPPMFWGKMKKPKKYVPVPPLMKTAGLWGFYNVTNLGLCDIYFIGLFGQFIGSLKLGKPAAVFAQAFNITFQSTMNCYVASLFVFMAKDFGVQKSVRPFLSYRYTWDTDGI